MPVYSPGNLGPPRLRLPMMFSTCVVFVMCLTIFVLPTFASSTTMPKSVHSSAAGSTNWPMFGFSQRGTHFNPHETTISPANVSKLVVDWANPTAYLITNSPVLANGVVYISSTDHLYAFNATNGARLWTATTDGPIYAPTAVVGGILYVGSAPIKGTIGKLFAFNAATGKRLWATPTGGFNDYTAPVIANGIVYVSYDDGKLYAFNAQTGSILWNTFIPNEYSTVAVVGNIVYAGSSNSVLVALNSQTGKILWNSTAGSGFFLSPAVVGNVVYITSNDGHAYAYNASTGKLLWVTGYSSGTSGVSPAIAYGMVYTGADDGNIYALNAQTGKKVWSYSTGAEVQSVPDVANGIVYVGSTNGTLYALNARTGKLLWSYTTGSSIVTASAIIANGIVYVGSEDDKLYAFHLS